MGYSPWGGKESDMTEQLRFEIFKDGKLLNLINTFRKWYFRYKTRKRSREKSGGNKAGENYKHTTRKMSKSVKLLIVVII